MYFDGMRIQPLMFPLTRENGIDELAASNALYYMDEDQAVLHVLRREDTGVCTMRQYTLDSHMVWQHMALLDAAYATTPTALDACALTAPGGVADWGLLVPVTVHRSERPE